MFDVKLSGCYILQDMTYLRSFSKIVFFAALIALGNMLIVQPAMEIQKKSVVSHCQENSGDESTCCFICHPSHHQWLTPNWFVNKGALLASETFINPRVLFHSDPPAGSIFHPPSVL